MLFGKREAGSENRNIAMTEDTIGGLTPRAAAPEATRTNTGLLRGSVRATNTDSDSASFGPFHLFPRARAIERDGIPLAVGSRALDILIALVERAGDVVSHKELLAHAWRGLVVDPGNLRVHISSLRKALGDDEASPQYIANVAGQGYCFVAPVMRGAFRYPPARAPEYPCGAARRVLVLPPTLQRMVGRDDAVRTISEDLIADRFVTVMGPGGMGKTTVAVAVAHAMLPEFGDAVCFVDVGAVSDPRLVAATIASALGLTVQTADVLPTLLECLRALRILLVLDNCEHVIDEAATLAELIYKTTVGVHILATSREALRVEGEHLYLLPPLVSPAPDSSLKAAEVIQFPAVKLFLERVSASGSRFELGDSAAPVVAGICGRLDGLALAIELAAARAGSHGITGTAELLEKGLGLNWQGRRTAHPRHQTLRALLDWSYGSLPKPEQTVLTRLSILIGPFNLEAAQAIVCDADLGEEQVADTLDRLLAKSLVSTSPAGNGTTRYRLLETTRVYASKKLEQSGEAETVACRHASHLTNHLEEIFSGRINRAHPTPPSLAAHLGNVRAALAWCFAQKTGDPERRRLAFRLTAASTPLLLELSLLNECYEWSGKALTLLDDTTLGTRQEMVLQETRAISGTWTRGNGEDVRAAIDRGLEIARQRGDAQHLLRLLVGRQMFLIRIGDFRGSRAAAEELAVAARGENDDSYQIIADWLRGSSEHFMGNQAAAQQHYETGFARPGPRNVQLFGLDHRVWALVAFARVLWLSGSPKRAMEVAREAITEAAHLSLPVNVCFAFLYTAPVFLWCGDYDTANEVLEKLMAHPNWKALPSLRATGLALRGELLLRTSGPEDGIALLVPALNAMRAERQKILFGRAACVLGEALTAVGRPHEALSVINDAISDATVGGEPLELPEMLRIKAIALLEMPHALDPSAVEGCLEESLACARRQSAASWEVRTAITLAQFRARRGSREQARRLLASACERFTDGLETSDLKAAKALLHELS
jgi:predicted ATPase/DNA-binding winged helix-turn-helix (wHTH) protein